MREEREARMGRGGRGGRGWGLCRDGLIFFFWAGYLESKRRHQDIFQSLESRT